MLIVCLFCSARNDVPSAMSLALVQLGLGLRLVRDDVSMLLMRKVVYERVTAPRLTQKAAKLQRKQDRERLAFAERGLQPPPSAPPVVEAGSISWGTVCSPGGWAGCCVREEASKAALRKPSPSATALLEAAKKLMTSPAYVTKEHPPHQLYHELQHYLVRVRHHRSHYGLCIRAQRVAFWVRQFPYFFLP